jgi:hypothetical protein
MLGHPTRESTVLRRSIACPLLLCYLAACTSWHVQEGLSPLQLISTKHPKVVRLTHADGSHTVIDDPQIAAGDSVTGIHDRKQKTVAVSDVTQVATQKVSAVKTVGVFLGLGVVAVGIAAIACLASPESPCNGN